MFFFKRKKKIIGVDGMHCDGCATRIEKALGELSDVDNVRVELKKKRVIVYYSDSVDDMLLKSVIENLGYVVTGIKEIQK